MSDSLPDGLGLPDDQPTSLTSFFPPGGNAPLPRGIFSDFHVLGSGRRYDNAEAIPLRPEALVFPLYPFTIYSTLRLPHGRIRDT